MFVLDHMLSTSEDDTKGLTHVVKVCLTNIFSGHRSFS